MVVFSLFIVLAYLYKQFQEKNRDTHHESEPTKVAMLPLQTSGVSVTNSEGGDGAGLLTETSLTDHWWVGLCSHLISYVISLMMPQFP